MNADLSVAPEIAQLAAPFRAILRPQPAAPATAGRRAAELTAIAAEPRLWWDLVRFDARAPVRIPVPGTRGIWLLVLPPGATADCDCACATLLAGEATESAWSAGSARPASPAHSAHSAEPARPADAPRSAEPARSAQAARPLHSGRVRVHGGPGRQGTPPHRIHGAGHGYAVSLHAAGATDRSDKNSIL